MKCILLLSAIIFPPKIFSQKNTDSTHSVFSFTYNLVPRKDSSPIKKRSEPSQNDSTIVRGKLIDAATNEIVLFAKITFAPEKASRFVGTISNADGEFRLAIPNNLLRRKNHLAIQCLGYETSIVKFKKKQLPLPYQIIKLQTNVILLD